MAGRVIGGVVNAHSIRNSSNLGFGVRRHTESATWGKEKATVLVLDTVQQ